MSPQEQAIINRRAERAGLSQSAYLRALSTRDRRELEAENLLRRFVPLHARLRKAYDRLDEADEERLHEPVIRELALILRDLDRATRELLEEAHHPPLRKDGSGRDAGLVASRHAARRHRLGAGAPPAGDVDDSQDRV